jgi:hypothetical protein
VALQDVVRAVAADFAANGCPARVLFGKQYIAENDSPNRVVFVQTDDTYQPNTFGGRNPREVYVRNVGGEAHIWAAAPPQADASLQPFKDQEVLDALVNQVVLSLYNIDSGPGVTITNGSETQGVQLVRFGLAYVLRFTVQIPLLDIAFPDLGIDQDVKTWDEVSGVTADTTVALIDSLPPDESD